MLPARFARRITEVAADILEAQRPIRVLRQLAWPDSVASEFFARGARALPVVSYPVERDWSTTEEDFRRIRARVPGDNELERLLRDACDSWMAGARMLAAVGTRAFHARSVECYGRPESLLSDGRTTNLMLADHFDRVIRSHAELGMLPATAPTLEAEEVAARLERRLGEFFAGEKVRCEVADTLSANAVAGAGVVKVKRGARFTERDVEQLLVHEGHVHMATSLNGFRQPILTLLARGAPRTTCTQEGLAIFAEFMSQTIDLDRVRRLADRVFAVRMSEDGADFVDLYQFFRERGHGEVAAFDCARRVVRGGLVAGGAPFTKDVVYLHGLVRVSNFLRVALVRGRADYVRMLFAGKVALEDVPILVVLEREGAVVQPAYLPPWASDPGFLTAYLGFSAFLQQTDLVATGDYYDRLIARSEGGGGFDSGEEP